MSADVLLRQLTNASALRYLDEHGVDAGLFKCYGLEVPRIVEWALGHFRQCKEQTGEGAAPDEEALRERFPLARLADPGVVPMESIVQEARNLGARARMEEIFEDLVMQDPFTEFLTLPAYDRLTATNVARE